MRRRESFDHKHSMPIFKRIMEPRTSAPAARLDAVAQLRAAGIPVA